MSADYKDVEVGNRIPSGRSAARCFRLVDSMRSEPRERTLFSISYTSGLSRSHHIQ